MIQSASESSLLPNGSIANPTDLGKRIRAARRNARLSQQDLADACGVGRRFISELEAGKPTAQLGLTLTVLRNLGLQVTIESRDA